jgi:hypothetical protein
MCERRVCAVRNTAAADRRLCGLEQTLEWMAGRLVFVDRIISSALADGGTLR